MKHNQGLILSATVLATLAMGATTLTANAATTYKRGKITKVSSKAYYSQRQTGKTYQFKGTAKKLTFKANHALKNYTKTTWQASKKTAVTKNGKQYLYYYVRNSRNGATGWVYSKYLKAGKNFQATTATTATATTYTPSKAGKVYTLSGDNTYIKFSNGQALKTGENYTQTQQRYVYKAGKKYLYYFVTSADKKVSGWTWHGYLKATDNASSTTNTNNVATTEPNNNADSSTNASTSDSTPAWTSYDGKRSPIIIYEEDFNTFLRQGNTYSLGVYYGGELYTNMHYKYDTSNPYVYQQKLVGTVNGQEKDVPSPSWKVANVKVPADGDTMQDDENNYFSIYAPAASFKPGITSQHEDYVSGANWFQYNIKDNNYTQYQYNLTLNQWDKTATVKNPYEPGNN
ncbi:hypothetical protein ACFP3T_01810 [Lactiplantibacillus dongliensis]|uniref:Uncharacterized protein n=1 Tax=Lactiplantibacillus dongliensis TaxID=2559919 RepID=A0ABW1R5E8_9LACO|nr:hypothetical protein [Lactiplantibacillus dongliensis]